MQVIYGGIPARCPRCGSEEFELVSVLQLTCVRCAATSAHADLLAQIGDEAAERSRRALEAMRLRFEQKTGLTSAPEAARSPSTPATPESSDSQAPPRGAPRSP